MSPTSKSSKNLPRQPSFTTIRLSFLSPQVRSLTRYPLEAHLSPAVDQERSKARPAVLRTLRTLRACYSPNLGEPDLGELWRTPLLGLSENESWQGVWSMNLWFSSGNVLHQKWRLARARLGDTGDISSRRCSLLRMDKRRGPRDQSGALGLEAATTSRFASFLVGSLAFAARTATLTSRS